MRVRIHFQVGIFALGCSATRSWLSFSVPISTSLGVLESDAVTVDLDFEPNIFGRYIREYAEDLSRFKQAPYILLKNTRFLHTTKPAVSFRSSMRGLHLYMEMNLWVLMYMTVERRIFMWLWWTASEQIKWAESAGMAFPTPYYWTLRTLALSIRSCSDHSTESAVCWGTHIHNVKHWCMLIAIWAH